MRNNHRLIEKYVYSDKPKTGFELVGKTGNKRVYRHTEGVAIEDGYYDHIP